MLAPGRRLGAECAPTAPSPLCADLGSDRVAHPS